VARTLIASRPLESYRILQRGDCKSCRRAIRRPHLFEDFRTDQNQLFELALNDLDPADCVLLDVRFERHAPRAAATWAAAAVTELDTGVTVNPDGLEKVAAGRIVKEPDSAVPMTAPVVSTAVATREPGVLDGVSCAVKLQGGVSVPSKATAGCEVPVVSVTTTLIDASAVLPVGSGSEATVN